MKRRIPQPVLYFLAPAILIVVACTQRVFVHTHDLTAWKGGGFGMFSTFEPRTLRLHVLTTEGEALVAVPNLKVLQSRVLNFPNDGVLRDLAEQTVAESWVLYPPDTVEAMRRDLPEEFRRQLSRAASARRTLQKADSTAVVPDAYPEFLAYTATKRPIRYQGIAAEVTGARAEVWHLVYDRDTHELRGEMLRSVTVTKP